MKYFILFNPQSIFLVEEGQKEEMLQNPGMEVWGNQEGYGDGPELMELFFKKLSFVNGKWVAI